MFARNHPARDRHSRTGQVCIAVRDTHGVGGKDPYRFEQVKERIEAALRAYAGRFVVIQLPNIASIFYGRDVGYTIERLSLSEEVEQISATAQRDRLGLR